MRLYRSQVPAIVREIIDSLIMDGDIVVEQTDRDECQKDVAAIMDEYLRQENKIVQQTRELMERSQITYDQFSKVKQQVAEGTAHATGDDGIKWIAGQVIENFMISRYVAEVFGEDKNMRKTIMRVFRKHLVEEADLDREVRSKIKNVRPGTPQWEIEYTRAMGDLRRKRGLV